MATIERPRPEGLAVTPTYSQVVVATGTRTVYVAGQVAQDAAGNAVGVGDLGAQTRQVLRNLGAALAAADATFADVVKIVTYVVDYRPEHRGVIAAARSEFFPAGLPPASTLVGVQALAAPEWLIEIEAVAVVD